MDLSSDRQDQKRQDGLIAASVVLTVMAGLFVILRCISRFVLIRNAGKDDYLIVSAMILIIGYLIGIFVMKHNHIGFPMALLTPENMTSLMKTTLAIELIYYSILCCIKTSILFTYLRFALTRTFRLLCRGTIVLHTVFFFICFVVTISQCRPLHKMWDVTRTEPGTCINTTAFFYCTSAFNIATDIWILGLPFSTLRLIQRPKRDKIALLLIFGAGTFATISSVVRLHTIYRYTEAKDPFKESIIVNLWSMIEVCVAAACASVPALKPVFSRSQRMRSRRAVRTVTEQTCASESRSGSQMKSMTGLGRWHSRLGSKDLTERLGSRSGDRDIALIEKQFEASSPFPNTQPIPQMQQAVVHGDGRPGPRPVPFSPSRGSWLRGVDSPSDTDSSMLVFTPLSPRTAGYHGKDGHPGPSKLGGMSSSGSTLILQK